MQTVSKEKLNSMNNELKEDFVLINVLPPEEFNRRHIRTSINIPNNDDNFVNTVEKVSGDKTRKIVLYCHNFDCDASTRAARRLDEAGFADVYDYEGGTEDWYGTVSR